jgi:protein-tyrosine phosphatase
LLASKSAGFFFIIFFLLLCSHLSLGKNWARFLIDRGFVFDGKDTFFVPIPDSAPPSISDLMDALHPRMQAVLNVAAMTEAEVHTHKKNPNS